MCLLEAAAAAVPVVATRTGGVPDIVDNGISGFLTPPGDAAALADAIARLLRDEKLRAQMAENALSRFRREFSASVALARLEEIYEQIDYAQSDDREAKISRHL